MKIQDLKEGCAHGEYYCSTDKKWKCRQGPKQTREGVAEGSLEEIDRRGFLRGLGATAAAAAVPGLAKAAGQVDFKSIANQIKDVFVQNLKLSGNAQPTSAGKFKFTFDQQGKLVGKEQLESCGDQTLDAAVLRSATNIPPALVAKWQSESPRVSIAFGVGDGWWKAAVPASNNSQSGKSPDNSTENFKINSQQVSEMLQRLVYKEMKLKDPESAKFKNIKLYSTVSDEGKHQYIVYGEITAKNSYGGYVGYKEFAAAVLPSPNGKLLAFAPVIKSTGPQASLLDQIYGNRIKNGKIIFKDIEESVEQDIEEEKQRLDPKCWDGYKKQGTKIKGGVRVNNCVKEELEETYHGDEFYEAYGELWYNEDEQLDEAEYQGRSVPLGKPMQGDVKKFKVYVKDPSTGNVKKVNFGDPDMKIRKSNPAARRSFRARHNCDNPGPRTKARYWSCRKW
jgi:hypothetical protein